MFWIHYTRFHFKDSLHYAKSWESWSRTNLSIVLGSCPNRIQLRTRLANLLISTKQIDHAYIHNKFCSPNLRHNCGPSCLTYVTRRASRVTLFPAPPTSQRRCYDSTDLERMFTIPQCVAPAITNDAMFLFGSNFKWVVPTDIMLLSRSLRQKSASENSSPSLRFVGSIADS